MTDPNAQVLKGHCLCGACTFELVGPHNWVGHCHCESCRRAVSSPFTTWIGHENGAWTFGGAKPVSYVSSPGNTRGFFAALAVRRCISNRTDFQTRCISMPHCLMTRARSTRPFISMPMKCCGGSICRMVCRTRTTAPKARVWWPIGSGIAVRKACRARVIRGRQVYGPGVGATRFDPRRGNLAPST